jgi:putative ABC transport system permease protein
VLLGLASTYGVTAILHRTSPTLQIDIEPIWIFRAILVAVIGAVAGATYPALRAARSDPVDALACE